MSIELFARPVEVEIVAIRDETLVDRKTGEVVTYYRIHYLAEDDRGRLAGDITCGARALPDGDPSKVVPGRRFCIVPFFRARGNSLSVSARSITPVAAAAAKAA